VKPVQVILAAHTVLVHVFYPERHTHNPAHTIRGFCTVGANGSWVFAKLNFFLRGFSSILGHSFPKIVVEQKVVQERDQDRRGLVDFFPGRTPLSSESGAIPKLIMCL
jgi:hypothetical protein